MNRFVLIFVSTLLSIGFGLSNVSADSSTYDTNGSVTFAVDPDNPDKPVTPDNGGGGSETTDDIEQEDSTTTHSYEKPASGVTINDNNRTRKLALPETAALQLIDFVWLSAIGVMVVILSLLLSHKKSIGLRGMHQ